MLIGWYDIPDGVVFSFPVTMHPKGYWNVVQDIELTEEMKAAIKLTVQVKYYFYFCYSYLC
jgi:malate/lactate dehydrogenase